MSLKQNILNPNVVGMVACAIVGIPLFYVYCNEEYQTRKYNHTYENALIKYADTNRDGIVSAVEKDAFCTDLLKDKGVTLIDGRMPKFLNGNEVPIETLTEWIEKYQPSK